MRPTRRAFLAGTVAGAAALAGCSGGGSTTTEPSTTVVRTTSTAGPASTTATASTTVEQTETTTTEPSRYSPPAYADRSSFSERTLSLSAPGDCSLGATLTVPDGDGPVPGVVLVHGSGPQDRDEAVGPLKPFKDLAWGLATRGVAVLRYDKRTAACEVDATAVTIDDVTVDDALTAADRLRAHGRVDAGDVVVAGHSLGGALAPRIAKRDGDLAGIALLAANARPLPDLIVEQNEAVMRLDGDLTDRERQQLQRIRSVAERLEDGDVPEEQVVLGGGRPYWQSLADYDQVSVAQSLSLPVFLAQGDRDRQVSVERDFRRWQSALPDDRVTAHRYENATHFFTTGTPPGPMWQSPALPDTVLEPLIVDLAAWCRRVTDSQ